MASENAFSRNMLTSLVGTMYDMKHWSQLPPQKRREGFAPTLTYVLTRDGRFTYLLLWVTSFGLAVLLIACLCAVRHRALPPPPPPPYLSAALPYRY